MRLNNDKGYDMLSKQYNCVNVSAFVGVDVELNESRVDDVTQCEDRIVSQWREVSADEQHQLCEQIDKILRPLGLQTRLVVVERANSIALYFLCMTLLAQMNLRDLWRSGKLRSTLQSLFTLLAGATRTVYIKRFPWLMTEYERHLQFFASLQGKQTIR